MVAPKWGDCIAWCEPASASEEWNTIWHKVRPTPGVHHSISLSSFYPTEPRWAFSLLYISTPLPLLSFSLEYTHPPSFPSLSPLFCIVSGQDRGHFTCGCFLANSRYLLSGASDGLLLLWDLKNKSSAKNIEVGGICCQGRHNTVTMV